MTDTTQYGQSGVSGQGAESALDALLKHVAPTRGFAPRYPLRVDIGYFANVIDLGGGQGVAFSTDGVGTKVLVAELMEQYDTIGIDCVAMNVNDIICVGARPVSLVDYIACDRTDPAVFEALGKGLAEGARQSHVTISGGEISQVKEIVKGIDLIGAAIGHVPVDKINLGKDVRPGQVLIGLASTGVHSNGLTLARRVLLGTSLEEQRKNARVFEERLGQTRGAELLVPTRIYVGAVLAMQEAGLDLKAMVHITGGGLCNLNRVAADGIRFVIDRPLPVPPVFGLIQERGGIDDAEMHEVFNMGIGFVIVVEDAKTAETVVTICEKFNIPAQPIGHVAAGEGKSVSLPHLGLLGVGQSMGRA